MSHVIVLTVEYDGAPFHGFQRQEGLPTVQGVLEEALTTALGHPVALTGAGRTDAGVHALGQVVSFEAPEEERDLASLMRSLNALAAPHVAVREVRTAREGFDARHSALSREYVYRLVDGPVPPVFLKRVSWWVKGGLDVEAMREASSHLLGRHDFRSFCVTESAEGKETMRTVDSVSVERSEELGEACILLDVRARSFLHSMVRVIAGSLVEVGKGRRPAEWMRDVLEAADRSAAGPTAPPEGLTLRRVEYAGDWWLDPRP